MAETLLVLGGTGEAVDLARRLTARGHRVIYSLAGLTRQPNLPEAEIIRGGFGGVAGLGRFLRENRVDRLIDATHPYAEAMSRHAMAAARSLGITLMCLERPAWQPEGDECWIEAENLDAAFALAATRGRAIFVTSGRRGLDRLPQRAGLRWLIRLAEPGEDLPARDDLQYLFARGPFHEAGETALLRQHGIDVLVAKNSGGEASRAKLRAAKSLGLPVIMLTRPHLPERAAHTTPDALLAAMEGSRT